jgi:predicted component of type VI protein secretion system
MVQRVKDATEPFFPQRAKIAVRPPGEVLGTLVVMDGDPSYTEPIELVGESIRLGRDEDLAQVAFRNRSVSRLHARISVEVDRAGEQRLMLYDEGSTSGTYVNYEPVGINGHPLQHDDMINLGQVQLKIQVKPKAPPVPVHDDTIAMAPVHPGTLTDTVVGQQEDEFATAPYEPARPEPSLDDTQPFASRAPGPAPAPPPPPEPEDEEGVSTEPYVPMDFDD